MDFIDKILQDPFFDVKYFNPDYLFNQGVQVGQQGYQHVFQPATEAFIKLILSLLAIFFLFIISYTAVRMFEIRRKEHEHLHHEIREYAHHQREKERAKGEEGSKNEKWRSILSHLLSQNLNDWKLSIIEADEMLNDLTEQLGFAGETLGERLKLLDKEKFRNLNLAWEAHAMRNRIAHEGDFTFSHAEAKRIITIYEQIFLDY